MPEKNLGGRPLKFKSPEELQVEIERFFDQIKKGEHQPSVVGLACHLGTNKQTLLNYQEKDEFEPIIRAAKDKIEMMFTERAYNGKIPPNIFIFTAKNHYDYKDAQDHNLGGQKDNPVDMIFSSIDGLTSNLPKDRNK